jgi:hypothetical protein
MAGEGKIIGQDIVDQSAHDAVILLTKESDELLKKFVELAGGITTFRTALGNVKGYDDVTKAIAGQKTQLTELDKIKNQIKATDEKVRASMTLEAQILARVRQELREVNKETADFIKSNKMQEGSLDQLRATLNRLNKEYSALGAAERDAAKGKDLINKLQETRDKVYSLETSMGNWTRNVGNYKSGFSAIGNSVAQISREMPAFANSLNTGFMAISNNLPALSDAIKGIREQNKLLAAEGKPTESVLKQLGSAVFSWNTLLSVGVTLLTVYGGKIWDYITGNENAAKSTKELKKTVDDLNDAYDVVNMAIESTDYKNAVQNIQTLKDEVQLAKEGFISKDGVVKHYNDTLGTTMGIVKNLNDVEQKLIDNGDAYIEMMLMKASANLALEKAGNLALEAEQKRREKHKVDINAYEDPSMGQGFFENFMTSMRGELPYETVMNKFDKDIQESTDSMDEWNDIAKQFLKNAGEISKKMNFNYFGDSKVTKPKKAKKEKTSKEKSDEVLSGINGLDREIQLMNEKTDQATIERVQKGAEEKKKLNAKYAKDELDLIIENIKAQEAMLSQADKDEEDRIRKKMEGLNQYAEYAMMLEDLGQAVADIAYQREIERLEGREKKMNDYYDAEEKRVNSSFTSQADKERELAKLSAQREAEQKKIDQERRAADRKRAQAQKAFDVASIITSTALAVIKAYTEGDPYTKIPRAIAAGAAGAISLARAIAVPIPAYEKGTDNHPGGLAQVSEKGSELIVEPSGKTYLSPDKTAILNLPAKTKVIPHDELLKRIHQVATIKLANSGQAVNEKSMNIALQEAFNELTHKVDKLTNIIDGKQWGGDVYLDTTHISHVKSKVR